MEKQSKRVALKVVWPGFRGPRQWGKWMVMEFPDNHPDTHCEEGEYVSNEVEMCDSCGWIPKEAVCCQKHKVALRDRFEIEMLVSMIEDRELDPLVIFAWIAYVDEHRKELVKSPTFSEVIDWWNSLSVIQKMRHGGHAEQCLKQMCIDIKCVTIDISLVH